MLQEMGSFFETELNDIFHTGNPQLFFEKVHKVGWTKIAKLCQLLNHEFFLIVIRDMIKNQANFFFSSVGLCGEFLLDDVVMRIEKIKELVKLGFNAELIEGALVSPPSTSSTGKRPDGSDSF